MAAYREQKPSRSRPKAPNNAAIAGGAGVQGAREIGARSLPHPDLSNKSSGQGVSLLEADTAVGAIVLTGMSRLVRSCSGPGGSVITMWSYRSTPFRERGDAALFGGAHDKAEAGHAHYHPSDCRAELPASRLAAPRKIKIR
jgi:hypothetical protein